MCMHATSLLHLCVRIRQTHQEVLEKSSHARRLEVDATGQVAGLLQQRRVHAADHASVYHDVVALQARPPDQPGCI